MQTVTSAGPESVKSGSQAGATHGAWVPRSAGRARRVTRTEPDRDLVSVLLGALQVQDVLPKHGRGALQGSGQQGRIQLLRGPLRRLDQVFAVIAALGNDGRPATLLLYPGPEALDQPVDLGAGIVDVELPGDGVAGPLEADSRR